MMANTLKSKTTKSKKRVGRGYGSAKGGHTSGRGTKGQKARSSVGILFEGIKVRKSLLSRLPFTRGKGKFKAQPKPVTVNLSDLDNLKDGTTVNEEIIVSEGFATAYEVKTFGVKVLGDGALTKKLTISLPASGSAVKKIEKAGGKVI